MSKRKSSKIKKNENSNSNTISGRGQRERQKWRKSKSHRDREQQRQKCISDEELAKKKSKLQKKEFAWRAEAYDRVLQEAIRAQTDVETMISDYRQSKAWIKIQISTDANNFVQTQKFEKAQAAEVGDQIGKSKIQLETMKLELQKTKKLRDDIVQDSQQKWYIRLWRFIY